MKVPQRKYGTIQQDQQTVLQNPNLATHVPLIGLGCSSFSTFFSSSDDDDNMTHSNSGEKATLTAENISRDHPAVVGWIETIRHAVVGRGINLLDTAPWYGHGISEIVIGYALDTILANDETGNDKIKVFDEDDTSIATTTTPHKQTWDSPRRTRYGTLPRTNLIINTKIGRYESDPLKQFDFGYETTMQSVQRSLQRMNCGYIDVLQLHDPEFLLGMPMTSSSEKNGMEMLLTETIPALLECKTKGWTKGLGITGYPLEVQHEILVRCGETFGGDDGMVVVFDQSLVYCHCNLHDMSLFRDRSFAISERIRRDSSNGDCDYDTDIRPTTITTTAQQSFAKFCEQANINLMCAAPLSMGLLTNTGPPSWHPATPSLKEACIEAAELCRRRGVVDDDDGGNTNNNININISSLAVLFALSQREVGCTLIGMKNVEEVDVAADLAVRFRDVDFDFDDGSDGCDEEGVHGQRRKRWWWNSILNRVLSSEEKEMLELLMDEVNGPFAKVWSNGEYRWDGMAEVKKFWSLVQERKCGNDADNSS
mmetsp:Transcript_34806/g.66769  ORF Transcript_34806/g.66769 Transcript_34806/m.66769 type:complete len:539 (+) Transcript_34806:79-1695(+)